MGNMIDDLKEGLKEPIPKDVFEFYLGLFHEAARGNMPGYHLKGRAAPDDPPGYYLTNMPFNRGMMAVSRESKHMPGPQRQALMFRLMHVGEAIDTAKKQERFSEHFKPSDEEGALMVSGAFNRAMAECRFVMEGEHAGPDMDDLYRLASLYAGEED
ncbi:hypothetical protein ACODUO_03095 [Stenotrophomonas maltophilia]